MLILIGALVSLTYRIASPAKCDPFVQVVTFSSRSTLNTTSELRENEHGRLIAMKKVIHRKSLPYAVASLVLQCLLWVPAIGIFLKLGGEKSPLDWPGLGVLALGLAIWITSAVSGINGMKTVEQSGARDGVPAAQDP